MNLTAEELIKLVEEYDSKNLEFEDNTMVDYSELEEYNAGNIIVLLCLIKLNTITIDEMLEKCLDNLHK